MPVAWASVRECTPIASASISLASAVEMGEGRGKALEESLVAFVECVSSRVLDVQGADDCSIAKHGDNQLRAGRFLVREVAGIAGDVVRDDGDARPDRDTCEPALDREAEMCRRPRSAPGEVHDLVVRDAVDADPAPAGL